MFWSGLMPDEARSALVNKDKSRRDKRTTLKEAVGTFIKDGDNVAILHVQSADKYGNCIIRGTEATCPEMAIAAAPGQEKKQDWLERGLVG